MAKHKNITNKEIQRRFNFLAKHVQNIGSHVQSLSDLILHYIRFKDDEDELAKYLDKLTEEQMEKQKEEMEKDDKEESESK